MRFHRAKNGMLRFLVAAAVGPAARAKQFSRGQLLGPGCCRAAMRASDEGGLRAWEEPPTAEAIAGKGVDGGPMTRTLCAVECAALPRCTHFELNMHGMGPNLGACSVFASGGHHVTTACNASSERMVCFAADAFTGSGLALSNSLVDEGKRANGEANGQIAHNPKKLRFRSSFRYRPRPDRLDGCGGATETLAPEGAAPEGAAPEGAAPEGAAPTLISNTVRASLRAAPPAPATPHTTEPRVYSVRVVQRMIPNIYPSTFLGRSTASTAHRPCREP